MKNLNGKIKLFEEDKYDLIIKDAEYFKGKLWYKGKEEEFDIKGNKIKIIIFGYNEFSNKFQAITEITFIYNSNNQLIKTYSSSILMTDEHDVISFYTPYKLFTSLEFTYDLNGNLLKESYDGDNPYVKSYRYDNNNNIIYEREWSNGKISEHNYKLTYDSKGNIIEKIENDSDKTNYVYDDKNNLREIFSSYRNSKKMLITIKYDERGNETESISSEIITCIYDNNNNITERTIYDENRVLIGWEKYVYEKNNLIEELIYQIRDRKLIIENKTHKYLKFDEKNNWIKKIIICDDEEKQMITRNIKYHE